MFESDLLVLMRRLGKKKEEAGEKALEEEEKHAKKVCR